MQRFMTRLGTKLALSCLAVLGAAAPALAQEPLLVFDRALYAPSMFGNVLGTRPFVVTGPGGAGGTRTLSGIIRDNVPSDASFNSNGTTLLDNLSTGLTFQGVLIGDSDYIAKIPVVAPASPIPINEVALHTAAIQKLLAKPGETAVFNATASQARFEIATVYNIFLVYDFVSATGIIFVPNPADGGIAGRNRVSADSSPLPRDRVIFNYDFVSNARLTSDTPAMNRFVFGFEKTFLDGMASVEFRIPFASSVNSTSNDNGSYSSGHGEFGNVFLVLKALLASSDSLVVSAGLGVSLPTADDVRLQLGKGDILRVRNDAVILTPFVAALWTPSDRLFAQTWIAWGVDANGNRVETNLDGKGVTTKGRLYDPSTFQLDIQLGYWLIHPVEGSGVVRGFAPFLEWHFNQQLREQNSVTDGAFTLTPTLGQLSEIDMSTGFASQLGDAGNLMLGVTFPLADQRNRFSDWQLGIRLNYLFGPTARARVNGF